MNRQRNDPTNQNTVPVLDSAGRPLMPTRLSRARGLIRDGRAERRWPKVATLVARSTGYRVSVAQNTV